VDRCAVSFRKSRRDLDRSLCGGRSERPHRNDERAAERAGRLTGDVRAVHRDIRPRREVLEGNPGGDQRILEREGASEDKADEVVTPEVPNVGDLLRELAIAPDPVPGEVRPQIEVVADVRYVRYTRLGHADHRAWLRITLAE